MEAECAATAAKPADFPNDTCFRYQWHLRQIGLPEAWKLGQGKGVIVAVIDTGVSRVGDLAETNFVPGFNFISNNANAADDHGHGTHVAGTIAQSTNNKLGVAGVAFGVSIMPIKVLSARGSGSMAGIAQAIRWAADHGAQVINMSLGGPFPVGTIANAVKYARAKGVTIVAAAGNDGHGKVSYPARYPGRHRRRRHPVRRDRRPSIRTGARRSTSPRPGGNVRVDQNGDGKPDGVLQHTIVPGNTSQTDYLWFMGTSMASPHVAGVAALIVGAGVRKPDAVEEILLGTARAPKTKGESKGSELATTEARVDDHYGAGIVDAAAALRKVQVGRGAGELGLGGGMALLGALLIRRRGRSVDPPRRRIPGGAGRRLVGAVLAAVRQLVGAPAGGGAVVGLHPRRRQRAGAGGARQPAALERAPADDADGAALRRSPPATGAGRVWLRYRGRAAVRGGHDTVDVRYVPDFLDRFWLAAHATVAALFATAVLRKSSDERHDVRTDRRSRSEAPDRRRRWRVCRGRSGTEAPRLSCRA